MFIFTEVDTETTGEAARAVGLVRGGEATGVAFLHFVQAHETLQTLRVLDGERLVADTLRFSALNEFSKSWVLCHMNKSATYEREIRTMQQSHLGAQFEHPIGILAVRFDYRRGLV